MLTHPTFRLASQLKKPPLLFTVVVDLVSTHMFWYDKRTDIFLLPTQAAYERGLKAGVPKGKMLVTGIPVHPNFSSETSDKVAMRKQLGWHEDLPTLLVAGGGDGMGKLYEIASHICDRALPIQVAFVTGRNEMLQRALEGMTWRYPVHVYGFVENMHELMTASDLLVTKAGSLTISEAFVKGLPIVLYGVLPGQEEGNLDYVVDNEAGCYAPSNKTILKRIESILLDSGATLQTFTANARRLGSPNAVWDVADMIWQHLSKQQHIS